MLKNNEKITKYINKLEEYKIDLPDNILYQIKATVEKVERPTHGKLPCLWK